MFYPDNDTGIDVMPEIAPKQSDTVKWFTKGGKGIEPTVPGQDTWNIWQAELLNILNLANIKPDKTKLDQIAQAIKLIAGVVVDDKIDDGNYLEVSKNLEEIYERGLVAQAEARAHIGIEGDIAYRDKANVFTSMNTFRNTVEIAEGEEALIRVIRIMYRDVNNGYLSGQLNKVVKLRADGRLYLSAPSLDGLRFLTDSDEYEVYHTGNLNPVLSVNNAKPDANGNVTVSTGSAVDLSNYYTKAEVNALINSGDYASATPGAVKSYGLFTTYLDVAEGDTATGSSLCFTGISCGEGGVDIAKGSHPGGIWKILGKTNYVNGAFLAIRVS